MMRDAVDAYHERLSIIVFDYLILSSCRIAFVIQAHETDLLAIETSLYHLHFYRSFSLRYQN